MKTIILKEILGFELQTRKSARSLAELVTDGCIIDFSDVTFMSRSFADEICSIVDRHRNLQITNLSPSLSTMMDIVKEGRKNPRKLTSSNAEVRTFNDIKSLSEYLSAL